MNLGSYRAMVGSGGDDDACDMTKCLQNLLVSLDTPFVLPKLFSQTADGLWEAPLAVIMRRDHMQNSYGLWLMSQSTTPGDFTFTWVEDYSSLTMAIDAAP